MFHRGFRSVVVITSASHAEGRRFEPGRKHSVYLTSAVSDYLDFFLNCLTSCILSNDPSKNCTIFYCFAAISFPHIETVVFSDQEFIN